VTGSWPEMAKEKSGSKTTKKMEKSFIFSAKDHCYYFYLLIVGISPATVTELTDFEVI